MFDDCKIIRDFNLPETIGDEIQIQLDNKENEVYY